MQVRVQKSILAVLLPTEVTKNHGIYVLTEENFDAFLADNEYVLVNFYPQTPPGLKPLFEEFAKAAQILTNKGSPIKLAEVDSDIEEKELVEKFEIKYNKYSIVKMFKRDTETSEIYIFEYHGYHKANDIVSWVERFIRGELEEYNNPYPGIKKITYGLSFYLGFLLYLRWLLNKNLHLMFS